MPGKKILLSLILVSSAFSSHAFDLGNLGNLDLNKIGSIVSNATDAYKDIEEPEEIQIGEGIAGAMLGSLPLVKNQALQLYVNDIGLWIAQQTERKELPWTFAVINSDSVNAFAAPGGFIFITRGLFESLRDEAELAGVLAHEIAHVLKKHHLNAIQKNARLGLAKDVAEIAAQRKGLNTGPLINTGMQLYIKGLDKDDEFDADKVGVVLAARAGYQPEGLLGVLMTLDNMSNEDDALTLLYKTHPPASDRMQKLTSEAEDLFEKYESLLHVQKRLNKMQASISR